MRNNIEPTLFEDDEIFELLKEHIASFDECEKVANKIAGTINVRIKKLKDALDSELARLRASETNYARALGQIDGLKYATDVLSQKQAELNLRKFDEY